MKFFWISVYNWLFIPFFWLLLQFTGIFNSKIRRGVQGRKDLFENLERAVKNLKSKRRVWFHSSSMGEFEQAKPIIAALRKKYHDINIIVTFFSPSGYDHSKNYKLADIITYIPFDTKENACRFLDLLQPTAAVFVRYDVWPNHLWELSARGIPTFIANATMRISSARFYPFLKSFHRLLFNNFVSILTVSAKDVDAFSRFRLTHTTVQAIGETRYDQVWQRSADAKKKHLIPLPILKEKKIFIAGSTWPEDEEVLLPAIKKLLEYDPKVLAIIVPHEPTEEALEAIEKQLPFKIKSIRFSLLNDYSRERIILVDSVGILMALYQYAHIAYVGGSFRQGVHNVLEPAVYGIPVVYGPRHENSQEAQELLRRGGGFLINDQAECYRTLRALLDDLKARTSAGNTALQLIQENVGATERFMKHLSKVL
jgi:3-deoxy-D-manno-octulosonic-acid transferase